MPQWTDEQYAAITASGCDLLVSAAAGSGKTAVLTERIIRKCTDAENPQDIDRFLIVTFTNAAASEMRQRISTRLSQELELHPHDANLLRQLTLLNKASITTIHSFCLDIIRNNFHLLDIDPAFRPADETEAELLKLQAADEVLENMYSEDVDGRFARLAEWLGSDRSDEGLAEKIMQIYEFIRSFPYPFKWLEDMVEMYNIPDGAAVDTLPWALEMKKSYIIRLEGLIEATRRLADKAQNQAPFYLDAFLSDLELLEGLKAACLTDWKGLWTAAGSVSFANLGRRPKGADEGLTDLLKEQRNNVKDEIKRICKEITYLSPEGITGGLRSAYPLLLTLKDAVARFHAAYSALKKERSILDFGDFEHIALELLSDGGQPSALALELQERYLEIFVDEYQDCNGVQEAIFGLICRKDGGKSSNMFMVGDVKQSIYRFRQADPTIFMRKLSAYGDSGAQRKIILNRNFRSRSEILDCVNRIFSRIMSPYAGEINYDDGQRLYQGAQYPPDGHFRVELLLADYGPDSTAEDTGKDGDDGRLETGAELEARMVANRIKELMDSGFEVYDAKAGCCRKARYSDIVVLMRATAGHAERFEAEFEDRGIPYYTDRGGGYLMSLEVRIMVSLLKVIDNPLQDIPLIGVLRSPIFGFNENELLEIRLCCESRYFYHCVQAASNTDSPLGKKCRDFLKRLEGWADMAAALPTHLLIRRLLDQTCYYAYVGGLPGGELRQANLRLLYERAKQYEQTNFRGLFNFINFITKVRQHSDMGGAKTLSENCDVVRIMSVHKSKGLEFPIVFVCGMGTRFNLSDSQGALLLHRDLGLGIDFVDRRRHIKYRLLSKLALSERIRMDNLSEEMRILYVALTRAREKLIMTGVVKNAAGKLALWESLSKGGGPLPLHRTSLAQSFCDWVCSCIDNSWIFKIYPASELKTGLQGQQQPDRSNLDIKYAELDAEARRRLEYIYPYLAACRLPAKLSVTELKRRFDPSQDEFGSKPYLPEMLPRPKFLEEKRGLTPAEYGSAMHLVLRHIDLKPEPSEREVEITVQRLLEGGYMTQAEAQAVNARAIADFLLSPLGKRLRGSERVLRELPFNIELDAQAVYGDQALKGEALLVQGIIDCLFTEEGGCVLVDYKDENPLTAEEELIERYAIQLRCYALAAQKILKMPVKGAYLYLLTRRKSVEIPT